MATNVNENQVRQYVRQHYGKIAEGSQSENSTDCCGQASSQNTCCSPTTVEITSNDLYKIEEINELPTDVTDISLGCGDPVTLASLQPGQVVLDLGSGGGIDCFIAAKKVGAQGHVIGVDMTPAMLEKAWANKEKVGLDNVEFRLGEIEHLPVANNSVDVIISNCVINLSPDKPQVFREAFRVLKPGGKLAVSDVVTDGPLPANFKLSMDEWAGCVAGALDINEYIAGLKAVGFEPVEVRPVYFNNEGQSVVKVEDKRSERDIPLDDIYKKIFSAKISAWKPE